MREKGRWRDEGHARGGGGMEGSVGAGLNMGIGSRKKWRRVRAGGEGGLRRK